MLEDLLKTALVDHINQCKAKTLPEWACPIEVKTEDIDDKIFDIRDTKEKVGPIKCEVKTGEATYYNGDENHHYILRFIRYEEFIDQFRTYHEDGKIDQDWTKNWSRPDYIAYDITDNKRCLIIHELSSGNIRNKRKDGKIQLLRTVQKLCGIQELNSFFKQFEGKCYCFLSAKGCVDATPHNVADGFMAIYEKLPDPVPINNRVINRMGFLAFETKVVKI